MIAQVIVDLKTPSLNNFFDYFIPPEMHNLAQKGMRVLVPFGINNNQRLGYIINLIDKSDMATKSLSELLDIEPSIDEELFLLAEEILKIPFIVKASVYQMIIPQVLLFNYQKKVSILQENKIPAIIEDKFNSKKEWLLTQKDHIFLTILKKLSYEKIVQIKTFLKPRYKEKIHFFYHLNPIYIDYQKTKISLTTKQTDFIQKMLIEKKNLFLAGIIKKELLQIISPSLLKNLLQKKIILEIRKKIDIFSLKNVFSSSRGSDLVLNQEQLSVFNQIICNSYQVYLLYGKTGTGKTEIYLKLIEKVLKTKRQVLILVPEIILITPLLNKLKSKFINENIAIIHSLLTFKEQYNQYKMIKNNESFIILGTRSAIFIPLESLGMIIIDEEHDESFIQKEKTPYDVKELAKIRAVYHNIPLILGTATPSLESYYKVKQNKYHLLTLKKRALVKYFPSIRLVDMKEELKNHHLEPFSRQLKITLAETLNNKEQVIILINNKGYAPFLLCRFCSYVPKCQKCNVSLTVYKKKIILKCNYCGYQEKLMINCPKCYQKTIKPFGSGIEYIENYLKKFFSLAIYRRIDADTVKNINDYENIWHDFNQNKAQILLGTQMISKGLDFPKVTLAVILTADNILKTPNFKANEKTFQLLTQIAGRSGIHQKGKVIIQSYDVNNDIIKSVVSYKDEYILEKMLSDRQLSQMPPFSYVSKILICHKSFYKIFIISRKIKNILEQIYNADEMKVLGPIPSLKIKKKNNYCLLLTLKYYKWPLNLDFIINNNFQEDASLFFDRFATLF